MMTVWRYNYDTMVSAVLLRIKGRMWYQPLSPKLVIYVGINASSFLARQVAAHSERPSKVNLTSTPKRSYKVKPLFSERRFFLSTNIG